MEHLDELEATGPVTPSDEAAALLKRIVAKHREYGFPPGNYKRAHLTQLVEAGLLTNHGAHYSVTPLGVEVFVTL